MKFRFPILGVASLLLATPFLAMASLPSLSQEASALFENGDLIFREGCGAWSDLFRDFSPNVKEFSHVGLLCEIDGGLRVLHAEANDWTGRGTVRVTTIEEFTDISVARKWAVWRLKLPMEDRNVVVKNALSRRGVSFDVGFNLNDGRSLYCTELIYVSLKQANCLPPLKCYKGLLPVDAFQHEDVAEEIFRSKGKPTVNRETNNSAFDFEEVRLKTKADRKCCCYTFLKEDGRAYCFVGIFEYDYEQSNNGWNVYKRVATTV